MATLYISEFTALGQLATTLAQVPAQPAVADQVVAITAGSLVSNAFGSFTRLVLLAADVACSIKFNGPASADPVAVLTSLRLPANAPPILFAVAPGTKVAVIANP